MPLDVDAADLIAHPFGPSPRAREALAAAALSEPLDRYPEPPLALRKVLAARFRVPLDAVVVGAGIAELLGRAFGALLRGGDVVVANAPSWPLLPHLCAAHAVVWRAVPYQRADHDLDAVLAAIEPATRLVYLTSPGNPTGRALDAGAFARWLAEVPPEVVVVVDEAYREYTTRAGALDATTLVRASDRPLVVLRSFSKVHGLAGLRAGYAIATPAVARVLEAAAPPFLLARGVEAAAIAALGDTAHVARTVAHVAAAREALVAALAARGIATLESDAPFVLAADPATPGPRYFDGRYVMLPVR